MTDRPTSFPEARLSSDGVGGCSSVSPPRGKPIKRPSFTAAQRLAVFEAFGAVVLCQGDGCENVMRIKGCDIDHHLAWIDGGTHELSNWRPLCDYCHAKKSAIEHIANCKAKRIARGRELTRAVIAGEREREPSKIKGRGLSHPTLRRTMSGKVVAR